jgi:phosphocarrier protein
MKSISSMNPRTRTDRLGAEPHFDELTESFMSHETPVARRQVEIVNELGLHLRPADKFARLANSFKATEIVVRYNGQDFNGKSILELAMLAAERGTLLDLEARGPEAEQAVSALATLVESKFEDGPQPVEGQSP